MIKRVPIYLRATVELKGIMSNAEYETPIRLDNPDQVYIVLAQKNKSKALFLLCITRILIDQADIGSFNSHKDTMQLEKLASGSGWHKVLRKGIQSLNKRLRDGYGAFRWYYNAQLSTANLNSINFEYSIDGTQFKRFQSTTSIPFMIQIINPPSLEDASTVNRVQEPIYQEILKLAKTTSHQDKSLALILLTTAFELGVKSLINKIDPALDISYNSVKALMEEYIISEPSKYGLILSPDQYSLLEKMINERNGVVHAGKGTKANLFNKRYVLVMRILYWIDFQNRNTWAAKYATEEVKTHKDVSFAITA